MLIVRTFSKWLVFAAGGLLVLVIFSVLGGVQVPWPPTETTQQKPYADFVGREYRVISGVSAYAWNNYPDKVKIQSFSLLPPPGVGNRFVSYVTPLRPGQRVRIVSAWRHFLLFGFHRYYVVSVPGAELPAGIPITMEMNSDGSPDRRYYDPIGQ
ncbi:MAG: hypothetical protein ABI603_02505 [Acidobacteriota bacterium]